MVNVKVDKLFYELIQVALGHREKLSHEPTEREWIELFEVAEKQAVSGMAIAALETLSQNGQKPPLDLLYEWIGMSEQIKAENQKLNKCCQTLQKMFAEAGVQSSILKGQGIVQYYDEPLRELRQSGDIDIFVDCGREEALLKVRGERLEVREWDYKHAQLNIWDDVAVEMHYRVEVMLNLWKNRKLQKWFREHEAELFAHLNNNLNLNVNTDGTDRTDGLVTPTVEFNVFYILLHIYRHFLYEGVGMRQLMDYYFVLIKVRDERLEVKDYVDAIRMFGMERFAKGLMWVMQEVFGLERKYMIYEPLESEGRFILDEVMEGGNFGHHDQRLTQGGGKWNTVKQVCRHNWHLMSHYPADVVWAPVWFVWHKCWKIVKGYRLKLRG